MRCFNVIKFLIINWIIDLCTKILWKLSLGSSMSYSSVNDLYENAPKKYKNIFLKEYNFYFISDEGEEIKDFKKWLDNEEF